jgi:site-specific DNA recombinase
MARLPAHELEQTIDQVIQKQIFSILDLDRTEDHQVIEHIKKHLPDYGELVKACTRKITVGQEILTIDTSPELLSKFLEEKLKLAIPSKTDKLLYTIPVPFSTTRANKGAIIMSAKNSDYDPLDLPPHQLRNLVRGIVWREEHFDGMSIEDIAAREGLSKSGIRKIIMGSFDTLMAL